MRVNVQLINAQTDSHLWAETYDRKLTDILGVESEIAKRIAESLQAKLTGREEQALAVKPTNNPEAYDAYLRGLAFEARSAPLPILGSHRVFMSGRSSLTPILRSPGRGFVARRRFSTRPRRHSWISPLWLRQRKVLWRMRRDWSRTRLKPCSPWVIINTRVLRDYAAAKTTFDRVGKLLPGSSEVPYALGRVIRREGHWDQSIAYFEQALALDPRNVELLNDAASNLRCA